MKYFIVVFFSFFLLETSFSCPRELSGHYLWLNQNNTHNQNSFFNNSLELTVKLNEECTSLYIEWKHENNFTLAWENQAGDFMPVPGEEQSRQKFEVTEQGLLETLQNSVIQKTIVTTYILNENDHLEITVEEISWGSQESKTDLYIFQKI
jgi:hypothetical protein